MSGSAGRDRIDGLSGDDRVSGLCGPDILRGHSGTDVLIGGDGSDRLLGGPGNDDLFGGISSRQTTAKTCFEVAAETIASTDVAATTSFRVGPGDDWIEGGKEADRVMGGPGDDIISTFADGAIDAVECGPGRDTARVDRIDVVRGGCERVTVYG
jgi:Ca2+-binding RTX toxin-like protein